MTLAKRRTSLGPGSSVTAALTPTLGEQHTVKTIPASGASQTLDLAEGNVFDVTLTANCTFTFAGEVAGKGLEFDVLLRQDGTGGRTVTWPAEVAWAGGPAPVIGSAIGAITFLSFFSDDGGATWIGFGSDLSTVIAKSIGTTKGDLIGFSASGVPVRIGVGAEGAIVRSRAAATPGVAWELPSRALPVTLGPGPTNTVTETDVATVAIPTTVAAGDHVHAWIEGEMLQHSGSTNGVTLKFKLGGNTYITSTAQTTADSVNTHAFKIHVILDITNPASAEILIAEVFIGGTSSGDGILVLGGQQTAGNGYHGVGSKTGIAEDLTAAKNLVVTATLSSATLSSFLAKSAVAEIAKL